MPVHNASRWAAERPRSASLSTFAVPIPHDRLRRSYAYDTSLEALDLDTRVLSYRPARKVSTTRHVMLRPLPRPQAAPRTVERFLAAAEHVQAAAPALRYASAYLLPHEKADAPPWTRLPWPDANVTLFNGDGARYILMRSGLRPPKGILDYHFTGAEPPKQLRKLGPNSVLSVVALHTDTNRRQVRGFDFRHPVLLAVCKTFLLSDVPCDAGAKRMPRKSSWAEIGRELKYGMVPGNEYLADKGATLPPPTPPALDEAPRWPGPSHARPAQPEPLPPTAFEPVRMLRQTDHTGDFVHLLYPVSGYDGGDLLEFFRVHRHALTPFEARASHQMLGHALLADPLGSAGALHAANLFHQDLRPENVLFNAYVDFEGGAASSTSSRGKRRLVPKLQAHLIDFGHATPNHAGSVAVSTVYTHAPESFLGAAAYERGLAARRAGRHVSPDATFKRSQDDIWAFGMLLFRLLTPQLEPPHGFAGQRAFACPLVADYEGDPQLYDAAGKELFEAQPDGAGGRKLPKYDPEKLDANYSKAQALLGRWRGVHAAWKGWHARRSAGNVGEQRPRGNALPTPNGATIDVALGQVADMEFDFLGLLLTLLEPGERESLDEVGDRYGAQIQALGADYEPVKRAARKVLFDKLRPWSRVGSFAEQIWSRSVEATNAELHASRHYYFETDRPGRSRRSYPPEARRPRQPATTAASLARELYAEPRLKHLPRNVESPRGQASGSPFAFNVGDGRGPYAKRRAGTYSSESDGSTDAEDGPGLTTDFGSPPSSDFMPVTPEMRGGAGRLIYGSPDARSSKMQDFASKAPFVYGNRMPSGAPA